MKEKTGKIFNLIALFLAIVLLAASIFSIFLATQVKNTAFDIKKVFKGESDAISKSATEISAIIPSSTAYNAALTQLAALDKSVTNTKTILDNLTKQAENAKDRLESQNSGDEGSFRAAPFVNVMDYGVKGDGKTDDAAAIQKAFEDLRGTGGTIYFPSAIYMVNKSLTVYSNQRLYFENGATLKRMSTAVTHLLGTYTEATQNGYTASSNIDIIGATMDGNSAIDYKITVFSTGHASNLNIKNCTFLNGNTWHYIELNSTENTTIENCVFGKYSGGIKPLGEYIQLDVPAGHGATGTSTGFSKDDTPCRNIDIKGCYFELEDMTNSAIGNHTQGSHHNIRIYDNFFLGNKKTDARGVIYFVSKTYNVEIFANTFYNASVGVQIASGLSSTSFVFDNKFNDVTTPSKGAVTAFNNIVDNVKK